jgi:hypothetical protein
VQTSHSAVHQVQAILPEREDDDAADQAEEDVDREIDLFLELAQRRAELARAAEEHLAQEQDQRDRGRQEGDELEQHKAS